MLETLWLVPAFPLAGFLALILFGNRIPRFTVPLVGAGSVGLSAIISLFIGLAFLTDPPQGHVFTQQLWTWIALTDFAPKIGLHLDPLSLVMMLVITVIGFLIHVYSAEYMGDDEAYSRFFAYMNLFVAMMLTLVLADNLMLLYLGWEGVGLCSYLLIGFWYQESTNAKAAIKAFVMTRVGDTAMLIGVFFLFFSFGTLDIQTIMGKAQQQWAVGSTSAMIAAVLILGGALGKSAQLPLQTWLPDAMAGPTPVSALIHAATMVTAGVYLIARTHTLFVLAPTIQTLVAIIGLATLLIAGVSALAQYDIKRVLAYSTISQIGYMFLALGVGGWSAGMFHFLTHACFKALLFLAAGSVIIAAGHEQNMFRLGGLRRQLPLTFWTFLIGAASLAGVPLVTDGFFSKDQILWYALASPRGSVWLWLGASLGAVLTAVYTFRMVFLTFFGECRSPVQHPTGMVIGVPLLILAVLSTVIGFMETPHNMGNVHVFSQFMDQALPAATTVPVSEGLVRLHDVVCLAMSIVGILIAYILFLKRPGVIDAAVRSPAGSRIHSFLLSGCGFDWLYDCIIVRPFLWITYLNRNDFVDLGTEVVSLAAFLLHGGLSHLQTGRVRQYALGIAVGAVLAAGIVVLL